MKLSDLLPSLNLQTGIKIIPGTAYTTVSEDHNKCLVFTASSNIDLTVDLAVPANFSCLIYVKNNVDLYVWSDLNIPTGITLTNCSNSFSFIQRFFNYLFWNSQINESDLTREIFGYTTLNETGDLPEGQINLYYHDYRAEDAFAPVQTAIDAALDALEAGNSLVTTQNLNNLSSIVNGIQKGRNQTIFPVLIYNPLSNWLFKTLAPANGLSYSVGLQFWDIIPNTVLQTLSAGFTALINSEISFEIGFNFIQDTVVSMSFNKLYRCYMTFTNGYEDTFYIFKVPLPVLSSDNKAPDTPPPGSPPGTGTPTITPLYGLSIQVTTLEETKPANPPYQFYIYGRYTYNLSNTPVIYCKIRSGNTDLITVNASDIEITTEATPGMYGSWRHLLDVTSLSPGIYEIVAYIVNGTEIATDSAQLTILEEQP